jgi:hypothetical protein
MTKPRPNYVYVASSWRNPMQDAVVATLNAAKIDCYDFKAPEGGTGFHWSEVGVQSSGETPEAYLDGLKHPRALAGFDSDWAAMAKADACILVLPCGRSAHLEAGWMIGQHKPTAIYLTERPMVTPELMYLMADLVTPSMMELLAWLGVED